MPKPRRGILREELGRGRRSVRAILPAILDCFSAVACRAASRPRSVVWNSSGRISRWGWICLVGGEMGGYERRGITHFCGPGGPAIVDQG